MMEDELVKIWQSSPNQERIKFDKSRLMIDVQSNVDDLHKKIKFRDSGEQLAALVLVPIFAYYAYIVPFAWSKVASVLIILWTIYVIIRLRNAKKQKPGEFTEPYLEYLYKTRDYLNVQKQLLDSVIYWYILPCATLVMLFTLGPGITGRWSKIIMMGVFDFFVAIVTYILNKRAVKKQIIPRLDKIETLISLMEKS
jgi:hypothetical protein